MNNYQDNAYLPKERGKNPISLNSINEPENFNDKLKLHQNQFNKLIEQAMDINLYSSAQTFDVNKYLPKDDVYSSKIFRKYKNYLSQSHNVNNSKPEYNFGFPPEINNKNISEIPNDSFFDGDSKFDFNLVNDNNSKTENEITKLSQKKNENIQRNKTNEDRNLVQAPFFEVFIQEVNFDDEKEKKNRYINIEEDELNDIEMLNENIECNKEKENEDYNWYCLDFYSEQDENMELLSQKFLSFEI